MPARSIHRGAINQLEFLDDGEILSRDTQEIALQWSTSGDARPTTREFSSGVTRLAPAWLPKLRNAIDREISRQDGGGEVVTVVAQTLAATLIFGNGVVIFDLAESPDRPLNQLYVGNAPGSHVLSSARAIALHPDGRRIAIGSTRSDAPLQLWDARAGVPLAILEGHEAAVESVAFNVDGTLLASGSADRTVRVWKID